MILIEADAVLFDSDGVLVDSHEATLDAWRQLAAEFELDFAALCAELAGVRAEDTLARHVPVARLAEAVARLEDLEVAGSASIEALPGACELIEQLGGSRWAIVTSATERLARARWKAAGIPIPADFVTAEMVTAGKPDPEPYLVAAATLGIDPGRCVVFEDSPSGGVSGVAAGAEVVAVGPVPWPVDPLARIDDLGRVSCTSGSGIGLRLAVEPSPR